MAHDGIFEEIGEYDLMKGYYELVLESLIQLNNSPFDFEIISALLTSCAIDEESGNVLDQISILLNETALQNFVICGLFHKWTRVRCSIYELISEIKMENREIILLKFLENESNDYAVRIGLLSLKKINMNLAKIIASTKLNSSDKYFKHVSLSIFEE